MAKVGEEDPRWIVQDMGQAGTNVGRWHWTEQNVIGWCKDRLNEILNDLTVVKKDGCQCQIVRVNSVKGDATVSNRKRRLLAFYELDVELSWRGELTDDKGETTKVRGKVKMPYISDENNHDEFDITCTLDDTYKSQEAQQLKDHMQKEGLPIIKDIVAEKFVKELRAGAHVMDKYKGWETDYLTYKDESPAPQQETKQQQQQQQTITTAPKPTGSSSKTHHLNLRERFTLPPTVLFGFFVDPSRISSYTRTPAKFEAKEGGKFEFFGGTIYGEVTEIKPNEKVVMKWRMRDWADDQYSTVTLTFEQQGGGDTLLTLDQTNIPQEDKYHISVLSKVEEGWKEKFFKPIKLLTGQLIGY